MAVANVVAKFEADISDVQAKMAALKASFATAGTSAESMSARMVAVGNGMATVGRKMTLGVTLPLAAIGAASVKAAMDFESSMAKIEGLVGIASDEVKAMGEEALAMSANFGKSGNEAADALFFITSAGLRGADAMSVLEASMKASAIGLGDTATIADLATSAVNAYGTEALSASSATDIMVAAVREGKLEASDLAGSMGRVLPIASAMGISFDQVGATFAALSRTGTGAAEAATQLRGIMSSLLKPSQQAEEALAAMGLSSEGLRKQLREEGLLSTLQTLSEAFGENEAAAAMVFGNVRALSGVMDLMGANVATTEAIFQRMTDTAGMTDQAFAIVADTAEFKLNQAMASLKNTLIEIGAEIMPIATQFADFAKTVLSGFQALPGPMKQVIIGFGTVVAVLGPLLWIGGKIIAMMGALSAAFIATRAKAVLAFRQISAGAKATQIQIQTSMIAARTSMGALVAGARAAGAGVVATFRTMTGAVRGFMAALGPVGLVIMAASFAYEAFVGAQQEAEDKVNSLTDAMKEQNAVMGEAVAMRLAEDLQELAYGFAENTKFVDDLAALGLTLDEVIIAIMQGGDAMQQLTTRVNEAAAGNDNLRMAAGNVIGALAMENDAITQARAKYEAYNTAKELAARITGEVAAKTTGLTSATVSAAIAAGEAMGPTQGLTMSIDELGAAAGEAATEIDIMQAEYNQWLSVTGQISAVDTAAASIDNLGSAAVELGTDLMGQTPKARDFRAEVIKAFEDSASAAQSLSDDLPTQRAIFTGELIKIVAALRASGVKPADIEAFLGSMNGLPASVSDIMRSAAKAIGDTDFKTQIEKAFDKSVKAGAPMTADAMENLAKGASSAAKAELGLTLEPELASIIKSGTTALRPTAFLNGELTGKSIGSGAAAGITRSSPIIIAAVQRVMAQAKAAADAAVESDSPSKLFARTGDDIGAGIAVGIARSGRRVNAAAQGLLQNLMRAVNAALTPYMGPVQSAIADIFGNVPSVREAERAVQDASWAVADARDAVADAEKALAEARKEGNAREIAAAERDLARARRDVSDATKALRDAQRGLDLAKYITQNKQAVKALEQLGRKFDYIVAKMEEVSGALTELQDLTAKPFGQASQVARMFGSDADIDGVISGYMQLRDVVTEAFGVLTDPRIVGRATANANREQMNATLGQLESLTAEAVQLREQYQANLDRIVQLEKDYQDEVAKINERYDALEAAGRANLASLENQLKDVTASYERENSALLALVNTRDQFLDRLADSTRQFVNNLALPEASPIITRTVREARRLANGILVTIDREISEGGDRKSLASALQDRLNEVRAFSTNIRALVQRGLDPAIIQQFVAAGVSGAGESAAYLAQASDDELRSINRTQMELGQEIAAFGAYAEQQWFAAGIAQQEAIVAPLQAQRDALAQSVADAKAALDQLAADRQTALDAAKATFEAEKKIIEDENAALIVRMDQVAAQIEGIIANLAATLPPRTVQAGQAAMQALLDGFRRKYPQVYRDLNRLMDQLAASLNRTVTITVRTVYEAAGNLPGRATGGPVQARTAYLVGERGPEVFVPYGNGNIIPNHALGAVPSMGARVMGGGAGAVININVNAGMGADGAEIGRHIVDSLRQYERRNGPIPVSVTG